MAPVKQALSDDGYALIGLVLLAVGCVLLVATVGLSAVWIWTDPSVTRARVSETAWLTGVVGAVVFVAGTFPAFWEDE